ncbi:hypothetical protein OSTOST_16076 [Ostertagia ostertagi]
MSLSVANSVANDQADLSMMPDANFADARNGTLGNAVSVLTTAKNSTCAYSYYAELNCTQDIFGYQAQIAAPMREDPSFGGGVLVHGTGVLVRDQMLILRREAPQALFLGAPVLLLDSCKNNGQLVDGACVCQGWEGPDCGLPICVNGGTREGGVCICPPNMYGDFCDQRSPSEKLNMVFILDSVGVDDTAFNSSVNAILEFVGLYNIDSLQIMLTDNANTLRLNHDFANYTTQNLYNTLTGVFPYRNNTGAINLDIVFSNILSKAEGLTLSSSKYIFYVTQSG